MRARLQIAGLLQDFQIVWRQLQPGFFTETAGNLVARFATIAAILVGLVIAILFAVVAQRNETRAQWEAYAGRMTAASARAPSSASPGTLESTVTWPTPFMSSDSSLASALARSIPAWAYSQ